MDSRPQHAPSFLEQLEHWRRSPAGAVAARWPRWCLASLAAALDHKHAALAETGVSAPAAELVVAMYRVDPAKRLVGGITVISLASVRKAAAAPATVAPVLLRLVPGAALSASAAGDRRTLAQLFEAMLGDVFARWPETLAQLEAERARRRLPVLLRVLHADDALDAAMALPGVGLDPARQRRVSRPTLH